VGDTKLTRLIHVPWTEIKIRLHSIIPYLQVFSLSRCSLLYVVKCNPRRPLDEQTMTLHPTASSARVYRGSHPSHWHTRLLFQWSATPWRHGTVTLSCMFQLKRPRANGAPVTPSSTSPCRRVTSAADQPLNSRPSSSRHRSSPVRRRQHRLLPDRCRLRPPRQAPSSTTCRGRTERRQLNATTRPSRGW